MLPLSTNPRAKMQGLRRGFVKLFCRPATGVVIGGVVVAPVASELILPIAMAVQNGLTVERPGAHLLGLPVAVRLDHRGGPAADAARRPGLIARAASNHPLNRWCRRRSSTGVTQVQAVLSAPRQRVVR